MTKVNKTLGLGGIVKKIKKVKNKNLRKNRLSTAINLIFAPKEDFDLDKSTHISTIRQALEPRYMFDGAAVGTVDLADDISENEQNEVLQALNINDNADAAESLLEQIGANDHNLTKDYSVYKEVVIFDSRVKDPHTLIKDISRKSSVEIIDINKNGVNEIARILSKYDNLDAVHIISHGNQGELYLGNVILNSDSLSFYKNQLANWGQSLSSNGDLLFYGCNVAEGTKGMTFIDVLKSYTHADIAASIDETGGKVLGGDSQLEYDIAIDVDEIIDFSSYEHLLVPPTITAGATLNYTENDAPVAIDMTITVSDPDSNISSAAIQITGNYNNTQDALNAPTLIGDMIQNWDDVTGTLTITSALGQTPADFQTALRAVTYENTSDDPNTLSRTVSWTLNDGTSDSSTVTSTINLTAINDPPTLFSDVSTQVGSDIYGALGDEVGRAVTITDDGSRIAFSSLDNYVSVYDWDGSSWNQVGSNILEEAADDLVGHSITFNNDGSRIAVSAMNNDDNGANSGHVRIYEFNGTAWVQLGADIDGEAANDQSGRSISLSSDGNTIAIGAAQNSQVTFWAGHVRVYEYNGTAWVQKGADLDGAILTELKGWSVSLSDNGDILAIGSLGAGSNGFVSIYQYNGTAWVQLGSDIVGEAVNDQSGASVSLSSDGTRVAIGAPENDDNGLGSGHVRVYDWNGSAWVQVGNDIDGEAEDDQSGWSVSLSSDGNTLVVGAFKNDDNGSDSGHVRIYQWTGSFWALSRDIDGMAADDENGWSVAVSADASHFVIGAPRNDGNGAESGQVRVYSLVTEYIDGDLPVDLNFGNTVTSTIEIVDSITEIELSITNIIDRNDIGLTSDEILNIDGTDISLFHSSFGTTTNFNYNVNFTGNTATIALTSGSISEAQTETIINTITYEHSSNNPTEVRKKVTIESLKDDGGIVGGGNDTGLIGISTYIDVLSVNEAPTITLESTGLFAQIGPSILGEAANDLSGSAVAVSGDGSIIAIGAPQNDGNGGNSGHVRVYQFDGTTWNQIGQDIDGEANADESGSSVALNNDGTILAIGAPLNDDAGGSSGHARVYQYNGTNWVQLGADIDGEAANDDSGTSVDLSDDGTILAVGAPINDGAFGPTNNRGHVRIYQWDGASWNQIGQDIDGEASTDQSGRAVSLNGDGTIVAIGAAQNDGNGGNSGHVRVYQYNGTTWVQLGSDIDGESNGDQSGSSVSLSSDGLRLAVGEPLNDDAGGTSGQVRVYEYNGSAWVQLGSDINGEGNTAHTGEAVALSADGNILIVGAPENDAGGGTGDNRGHVRVYEYDGSDWVQLGSDFDGENAGDQLGYSVAISNDGQVFIAGAFNNDDNGSNSGHVSTFCPYVVFNEGDSALTLFQNAAISTVESTQSITGFTLEVFNVSDGSDEILYIDNTAISLNNGNSGTTTGGNSLSYNVSLSGSITTVTISGGTLTATQAENLINAISYENISTNPNEIDRLVNFKNITDDGGVTNGGSDTTTLDIKTSIDVNAINNEPQGTDNTIIINEDATHTFSAGDFGFSDSGDSPAHNFLSIIVNNITLPVGSTLQLSTVDVINLDVIPVASLGNLVFTPAEHGSGSNYASFDFQVTDDGGTANGGQDTDQTANTITFDVTEINDEPTLSVDSTGALEQLGGDIDGDNPSDRLGGSVALNGDGTIMAVGAPHDQLAGNTGYVKILQYDGATWNQLGVNINGEAINDDFGISVALSFDGTILAVGAPRNDGISGVGSDNRGHVRLYQWDGSNWNQLGADIDGEAAGDRSGHSVSLSDDGLTVAIGAINNDDGASNGGHVRVYTYDGATWVQKGLDIDASSANEDFGRSVSISSDGDTVAIGAPVIDATGSGHVEIYRYIGSNWVQLGSNIDGEASSDQSGNSVSLSGAGNIVAIGAHFNNGINGANSGHVRVYEYDGSSWNQLGNDIDGEDGADQSGYSVSISDDGYAVLIGARHNNDVPGGNVGQTRLYVYDTDISDWVQKGGDINGEGSPNVNDNSGWAVALSGDGEVIAIGAPKNDENGGNSGHVRAYRAPHIDYIENAAPITLFENASVSTVEGGQNITEITFTITNIIDRNDIGLTSDEVLTIDGTAISLYDTNTNTTATNGFTYLVSFTGNTATIALTGGSISEALTETLIDTITYEHLSEDPTEGTRTITIAQLVDNGGTVGGGDDTGDFAFSTCIRVLPINDPPTLTADSLGTFQQLGLDIDGEITGDNSGEAIAFNENGTIVAVGAIENDGGGNGRGHVRVYQLVASNWVQMGSDLDGVADNDEFGSSVSLSSGGLVLAVGARNNDNASGASAGNVYIYDWNGTNWVLRSEIIGEAAQDDSGHSVALSNDGNTVAIGAPNNDGASGSSRGHVRVYSWDGISWNQLGSDIDGENPGDDSGYSISLSSDGTRLAIGAPLNDGNGGASGHTRVYELVAGSWNQIGQDIDGEFASDEAGTSVSISGDGQRLAIGAPDNSDVFSNGGHVRVYQWNNSTLMWDQVGADIDGEAANDKSGTSVALNATGNRLIVGSPTSLGTNAGKVHIYEFDGTNWNLIDSAVGEDNGDRFSTSVATNESGNRIAVGAYLNDGSGSNSGHVRVFESVIDYTENDPPVNLFENASVSTIETNQTIIGFTFTVEDVVDGNLEKLYIDGTAVDLVNGSTSTANFESVTVNVVSENAFITVETTGAGISEAQAETLVDNLQYEHIGDDPTPGIRVITVTSLTDNGGVVLGGDDTGEAIISTSVNVIPINDPIDINDPADPAAISEGNSVLFTGFSITDDDAGDTDNVDDITATIYLIGLEGSTFGSFSYTAPAAVGVTSIGLGNGNGLINAISFTGTKIDVTTTLNSLSYSAPDDDTNDDTYTLNVEVTDNANSGIAATTDSTTIDFVVNNVAPASGGDLLIAVDEGSINNIIATTDLAFTDVAADTITYRIDSLPMNGTLYINAVAVSINDTFSQNDIDTNLITYDYNGSETTSDSFTFSVLDEDGGVNSPNTFNITINPINDAPNMSFVKFQQLGLDIDGEAATDNFGVSTTISDNGNRIAVGAWNNDGTGPDAGHVRVYDWNGSAWIQAEIDIDGEAAGDRFGRSVTLSADGNRLAVGAVSNNGNGADSGHVRVFDWDGSNWIQVGVDIDGEAAADNFGTEVSLSSDGSRLAIGAVGNDGNGAGSGHVRIFEFNGTSWIQVGADIDGEAAGDQLGASVSLNAAGDRVAVGGYLNDGNGADSGYVQVYDWNGSAWVQAGVDIDGEAAQDRSGLEVSLSSDGNRLAINAPQNDGNGGNSGHVRIYDWNGFTWVQAGVDIDGEAAGDSLGASVVLSNDGNRVAIGASKNDGNGTDSGHLRIYDWDGSNWVQLGIDIDGEAAADRFGSSAAISADGSRVIIGAHFNDGNGSASGHVRVYELTTVLDNITYTENDPVTVLSSDILITDVDDINIESARVQITNAQGNDVLSYNATLLGTLGLTLDVASTSTDLIFTGTALLSEYESFLETITFENTSDNPDATQRVVEFTVNDGDDDSNIATILIDVIPVNDPPELALIGFQQLGSDIDGEAAGDRLSRVALSADGLRVAVGARFNDGNGSNSGHVRVYEYDGSNWVQLGTDIDGEATNDEFGRSITLNANGSRLAIGGPLNDGNGSDSGHVRVYEYDGSNWVQLGTDIDGEAAGDQSGYSVSFNQDGNYLAIGAVESTAGQNGHVRIFNWNGSAWVQIGSTLNGEALNDEFGWSVSLSSDGSRVAIGGEHNDGNGSQSGHARIYEYDGSDWVQLGLDIDGEAAGDQLGYSIALSSDGSRVAIGANGNDGNGSLSGHVRVFDWNGSAWVQAGSDIDGEAANDFSGRSLSLSGNGNLLAIGADGNDGNGNNSGHVRLYKWNGSNWIQVGFDINGEAADDNSATHSSVSLSYDGSTLAIGAEGNDGNGSDSGHVKVYDLTSLQEMITYTENESAVVLHSELLITDVDDINIESARIQITNAQTDDVLSYDLGLFTSLGLTLDGASTATDLIFIGTALLSEYESFLETITFENTSEDPDETQRIIEFTVNDGDDESNIATVLVDVISVNDPPILSFGVTQLGGDLLGEAAVDMSGWSVSTSSDGNIIAIGAPRNDDGGAEAGHVRIYQFDGTAWVQMGSDIDGLAASELAGYSTHLSADGMRVVVGAWASDEHPGGTIDGSIRIYEFNGTDWVLMNGGYIPSELIHDRFGSVAVFSDDGNRVAAASAWHDTTGNQGHVRIFEYDGSIWSQIGDIDGLGTQFSGTEVSIDADGDTVAITSQQITGNPANSGVVKIYRYDGSSWNQIGSDLLTGGGNHFFGYSTSLSNDGNTLVVGAAGVSSNLGQVYTYQFDGINWNLIHTLTGFQAGMAFGAVVSVSDDATRLAVSGTGHNGNNGIVRTYNWDGADWIYSGVQFFGGSGELYGWDLQLSGDGTRVINSSRHAFSSRGYAQVFDLFTITDVLEYTENDGVVALSNLFEVVDVDDTFLESAVVTLTNLVSGEDVLAFTNTANITGSINPAGDTITFTSNAPNTVTLAEYETI
ncbi:MAG: DUF4347 domain-containing protein [Gammaproteobacteria bacterium]|nr:MAG: DUF4347 domain-containing protein [Gammaproteobacteria bacterium]